MTHAVPTESLCELSKVSFQKWDGKQDIIEFNDLFVIGGAGIIDIAFAKGKPIVNAHPGIIPLTCGLDSFKWAIYNNDPVGNTLHLIDSRVIPSDIEKPETMLMKAETEAEMVRRFDDWKIHITNLKAN